MKLDVMKYRGVSGAMGELKGRKFSQVIDGIEMLFFVQGDKRSKLACVSDFASGRKFCQFYIAKERDLINQAKDAVSDFSARVGYDRFRAVIAAAEKVN